MEHRLPHKTTAARQARRLAADFVRERGCQVRSTEFLVMVSEIVANAVRYGEPEEDGRIGFRLEAEGCTLRAVVTDSGPEFTFDRGLFDESELGHLGLSLVDGLADRWGLSLDGKKAVWFEVDVPEPAAEGATQSTGPEP
ncbi:MAG TPA: ATP-binding protein [Actinomycetota bacterium]|nr:ATP-binding protein [Actinomycetota bacterium]